MIPINPEDRPTLIGRLFLWLLDQACLHTTETCRAYGGTMSSGRVRLCEKTRWHWDSHAYDIEEPFAGPWSPSVPDTKERTDA